MTFINVATKEDKEEILALYKAQLGREFCPWDENYPNEETREDRVAKMAGI